MDSIVNSFLTQYDKPQKSPSVFAFLTILFIGIGYFALCGVAAVAGNNRTITAGWAFLISLFLTPVVGIICVALSETNNEVYFRKRLLGMVSDVHRSYFPEAENKESLTKEEPKIKGISMKERKEQEWRDEIARGERTDPSIK